MSTTAHTDSTSTDSTSTDGTSTGTADGATTVPTAGTTPAVGTPTVLPGAHDAAVAAACARIAPIWRLESFVAVNPYLGLADHRFDDAALRLADTAGVRATLPATYYLDLLAEGRITTADVDAALANSPHAPDRDAAAVLEALRSEPSGRADERDLWSARVPTVASVATAHTGTDWTHLWVDRVSSWAAAYFDEGQAMWRSASPDRPPFASWAEEARIDRTPEIMGLRGFRRTVRSLPHDPVEAIAAALDELGVAPDAAEAYLHALLLGVGGWAAHAARIVWDSQLYDREDDTLVQFLAVLVCWELALLRSLSETGVAAAWSAAANSAATRQGRDALARRLVLQDAFDRAERRRLVEQFATGREHLDATGGPSAGETSGDQTSATRPAAQAVFCIDVRSEVFRRHLEAADPTVETVGFAGFFGFPVEFVPLAHEEGEAQCPVLLTPSHTVAETVGGAGDGTGAETDRATAVESRRLAHQVRRAWKSFKMGAVSCFSFVGPVGLIYLPKLFTDGYGRSRPVARPEDEGLDHAALATKHPTLEPVAGAAAGIPLEDRIALAEGALRAMSLTEGLAPLVLITGHGATTVNNPYDTGLDCGACGGHTGEANARTAAAILNDPAVRAGLVERGVDVPADTWFVAAQHDTTTDEITVFDRALVPAEHADELARIEGSLARAGHGTRTERAARLGLYEDPHLEGGALDAAVIARSADWAQVRPEWGLAGCRTFVVAPRRRTRHLDLGGRSFLHSYDWRADEGFGVLELVMTAPMVVASWISLQYYASTVDNERFGSGNKVLHNVTGRTGVLEGNGGDLRVGLPWQSVHDGEHHQHEPLRLNVVIEAPIDAMNGVIAAHPGVADLLDNEWLHLFALDDAGMIAHHYAGGLRWEPVDTAARC